MSGALHMARDEAETIGAGAVGGQCIEGVGRAKHGQRESTDGARAERGAAGDPPPGGGAGAAAGRARAARLRARPPQVVVTCARGSSAHAAAFGKHLIERYVGIPVAPAAPSIASIYGQSMHLKDQLVLAISQSGRSDDLIAMTESAKACRRH